METFIIRKDQKVLFEIHLVQCTDYLDSREFYTTITDLMERMAGICSESEEWYWSPANKIQWQKCLHKPRSYVEKDRRIKVLGPDGEVFLEVT